MRSSFSTRGSFVSLAVLAGLALLMVLGQAPAGAAQKTTGTATFTVGTGKAGKALAKSGGRISVIAPAKGKKPGKKVSQVLAPVRTLFIAGASKATLSGGIKFQRGKRKISVSRLILAIGSGKTVIRGKVGGKALTVFNATGKAAIDVDGQTVKVNSAKLALTKAAAKAVRKALKLKKSPAGEIGRFGFFGQIKTDPPVDPCVADPTAEGCTPVDPCIADPTAEGCTPPPPVDPYLTECGVAATSEATGSLPAATALPTLNGALTTTAPTELTWGFKSSFRQYVVFGAGGSFHGLDGATVNEADPVATGFDFPTTTGQYTTNGTTALTDDQAIINAEGKSVFCATAHKFRVVISNPTVVIDGENSRIVADIDTNLTGVWTPDQRIDLATLDLSGVTPTNTSPGNGTTWSDIPAELTAAGAAAICGSGEQPACDYAEGTAIDPITVAAGVAVGDDPYLAQCDVAATTKVPGDNLPAAAAPPTLTGAKATAAPATVGWGFKASFRDYLLGPAGGSMHALDDAARTDGTPTAGFTFPVSGGQYAANDPISTSDDQAVINGTGTSLYCGTVHGFRLAVSNPTIVIDGENSRLIADVDTNISGVWTPTQRIDIADLDVSGITPFYNRSGSEINWGDVPATVSSAMSGVIMGYNEGTALDPVNVSVKTPYDTSDLPTLATYVETNLPFPITDNTAGGCTLPTIPDPKTIDAGQAANPSTNPAWKADAAPAAAIPTLAGATTLTGGGFDWGFRSSLRGSINSTGEFNVAGGATANSTYFGNGPGGTPRVTVGVPGAMSGAGKFFTWPAATTAGQYDPAGAGSADDRLVLRTAGRVAFCQSQSAQAYGMVFSNPTVVIDGANSRITIDVATRYRLSWVRGTVDIASLDLSGATFNQTTNGGTTTVAWSFPDATGSPAVGPVTLTAAGEAVVNMLSKNTYVAGLGLDGTTIRGSFPAGA